jgi:hypothetical protein
MSSHDVERAFVAARADQLDDRIDRARDAMMGELDLYRDDFTTRNAELLRAHNERVQQIACENRAWLTSYYDDTREESHTDVEQQVPREASAVGGVPATPGPGPAAQPDPLAAELAEVDRLRHLPMADYARERQRLIRANRGLFSQETS